MGGRIRIAVLGALWACAAVSAWPQNEQMPPDIASEQQMVVNGEPVRVIQHQGGALCVVCRNAVHAHDRMYLIHGQRVAVHGPGSACDAAFRADPEKFLANLQPRGAFLGGAPDQKASMWWFYGGLYVLVGLVLGCADRRSG